MHKRQLSSVNYLYVSINKSPVYVGGLLYQEGNSFGWLSALNHVRLEYNLYVRFEDGIHMVV
jgi:hypothetical protein